MTKYINRNNNHKVASDFAVVIPYLRYTNGIVKCLDMRGF